MASKTNLLFYRSDGETQKYHDKVKMAERTRRLNQFTRLLVGQKHILIPILIALQLAIIVSFAQMTVNFATYATTSVGR